MDAASYVRGNADLPYLPQMVENLADVIGLGGDRDGLEHGELTYAAGVVKELVEGVEMFCAEIGDQGIGSLLAGTRAKLTHGNSGELPPIQRWLNRLLALRIATQNAIFEEFLGLILARRGEMFSDIVIHRDALSGAETRLQKLDTSKNLGFEGIRARGAPITA